VYIRQAKLRTGRILLLLAVLLLVGLAVSGCVEGLRPIGGSGGAVSGDTLFVGSKEGRLVAVNTADQGLQWSEPIKAARQAGGFGCMPMPGEGCAAGPAGVAIYGTPAVAGDLVYIGGYNGKVYAYNSSTLSVRWVYPREGNLEPIVGGLVIAQGRVYFGGSDGKLSALDAATGDKQWEFETGDKIWSTPAVDGDTLFTGSFDNKLYALNAADGSRKWQVETGGAVVATPLVYDDTVYVGSFDRYLYAIDADNGSLKWKFMGENWFWAKPAAYDGIIYAGCLDGKVYALNAYSGEKVAEFDLGSAVSSSPVIVDSSIIFASRAGVIYSLDTGRNELKQLTDIEEEVYGPIVASEGIIYIHTQDLALHRVNANTGAVMVPLSLESK